MQKWSCVLLVLGQLCLIVVAQSGKFGQRSLEKYAAMAVNDTLRADPPPALVVASAVLMEAVLAATGVEEVVAVGYLIYDVTDVSLALFRMGDTVTAGLYYKGHYDTPSINCIHGKIINQYQDPPGKAALDTGGGITVTQREFALIGAQCNVNLHDKDSGENFAFVLHTDIDSNAWIDVTSGNLFTINVQDSHQNAVLTAVPCSALAQSCPSGQYLANCGGDRKPGTCTACNCPAGLVMLKCGGLTPPTCALNITNAWCHLLQIVAPWMKC